MAAGHIAAARTVEVYGMAEAPASDHDKAVTCGFVARVSRMEDTRMAEQKWAAGLVEPVAKAPELESEQAGKAETAGRIRDHSSHEAVPMGPSLMEQADTAVVGPVAAAVAAVAAAGHTAHRTGNNRQHSSWEVQGG